MKKIIIGNPEGETARGEAAIAMALYRGP